jgi:molecular chaperone HtpG
MNDIVIGAKILDVLTTGMYPDALDALREYVQNSYDAIRRAERAEILKPNFGEVVVVVDTERQRVTIRDNGIGISAVEARTTLLSIGASKKRIGLDAGFRGIGRLAGLVYCDKLVFSTAYKDEPFQTELTFDAAAIRAAIATTSPTLQDETAVDLLMRMTRHRRLDREPGAPFFEVKLVGVNPKACPFLNADEVRPYLRQVAPVEFNMQAFAYAHSEINPFLEAHDAKRTINLTLEVEGRQEPVKKPYKTYQQAGAGQQNRVEIVAIELMKDPSDPPRWIAWISKAQDLKGVIVNDEVRGIRLRANNIQVGDYRTFSRIFEKVQKSYSRMNGYYSGEVHILDTAVVPNSRRDYFEDNDAWRETEKTLIEWAKPLVRRVYQNSNERNRDVELLEKDADQVMATVQSEAARGFAADALRADALEKIEQQERRLEKAMSGDRTADELDTLRHKKEEMASCRETIAAAPRSLIDESVLSRDERKILRLAMDVVHDICGPDLARTTAEEINRRLKAKNRRAHQRSDAPPGVMADC